MSGGISPWHEFRSRSGCFRTSGTGPLEYCTASFHLNTNPEPMQSPCFELRAHEKLIHEKETFLVLSCLWRGMARSAEVQWWRA